MCKIGSLVNSGYYNDNKGTDDGSNTTASTQYSSPQACATWLVVRNPLN